jgi:hypothetical protein
MYNKALEEWLQHNGLGTPKCTLGSWGREGEAFSLSRIIGTGFYIAW